MLDILFFFACRTNYVQFEVVYYRQDQDRKSERTRTYAVNTKRENDNFCDELPSLRYRSKTIESLSSFKIRTSLMKEVKLCDKLLQIFRLVLSVRPSRAERHKVLQGEDVETRKEKRKQ